MPEFDIANILQIIIGLGLFNVWILRSRRNTGFRGGDASTLREEFDEYGLPVWAFFAVGTTKIAAAVVLIAGVWLPQVVVPAAAVVTVLMVGALAMHAKVKDPPARYVPALTVLAMTVALLILAW
ncbi:MAG: DoxX family protein [Gemmatimonadota bacterium]